MDKQVVTTIKVVLTALSILFLLWILYRLAPIFATLLISLFVVLALEPTVKYFRKRTVLNKLLSRGVAVALTFTLFITVVVFIFTIGLPPVISQAQKLLLNLSGIFSVIPGLEDFELSIQDVIPQLSNLSGDIVDQTFSLFSNIVAVMSVLFLSLYMSLDWENLKRLFIGMFGGKTKQLISEIVAEVEVNIGHWVRGELLLMLIVGSASFLGLVVLGIDYPLALGLVAGLLEIVPILGPVIAGVLAAIVGFAASPAKGFGVIILFLIIQQLENTVLVPKIMQKVSGFSPLVILIALLIGGQFFGAVGAIVAVPLTMILVLIAKKVLTYNS
ncbi:hypothetical protein A2886_03430 [candidate division WWE3 bacterium RIFCSPHIGHO2_01_FULL_42_13]|uniref:AI-2E family transporter n=1 Tax=candidate division WWE3 bacterium RIFCSPHIGHO2_01_FULL_42_13 TaxID=1802617 RepID=A0A1F4URB1_UNCKA|nr:MAG: hypothetical protein A2886_03430 [candidate division WWE3 bacterium RIFCSPHIGHO2_01_FULL_42_13]